MSENIDYIYDEITEIENENETLKKDNAIACRQIKIIWDYQSEQGQDQSTGPCQI